MSKYLILINIGPVQDFIATARRSRDLWFGSWFLSEISKTAARIIGADNLIFPAATDEQLKPNTEFNSANKILAIVEAEDAKALNDYAKCLKNAVDARSNEIRENAFREIRTSFHDKLAISHLKDLIEFYWAAVEFDDKNQSKKSYEKAREEVEYLAAARKNTRQFDQTSFLTDDEKHFPKSSLDGKRESVIPENLYPKSHYQNKDEMAKELYDNFKVRDKERLCGVGLLKRLGSEDEMNKVASTPHIAALPFLKSLEKKANQAQVAESVKDYVDALAKPKVIGTFNEFYAKFGKLNGSEHKVFKNFDAKILFESRLKDHFANEAELNDAKESLKIFFTKTKTKQSKLSPYYAVLLADGDNMGKAIEEQIKNDKPIEQHRHISSALSTFAQEVSKIVSKHEGSLVYAGGDDVLALVPLHTILECAKELNGTFFKLLGEFKYKDEKSPTLSVGIAVAHYLDPLSDALELVRKAEKTAKSIDGKNALAIIVDKRSGTSRTIKGQFAKDKDSKGIIEYLQQLIDFDKQGDVSRQTAYELRDLARRLEIHGDKAKNANLFGKEDKELRDKFVEIKQKEAKRIIKRKLKNKGSKNFDEKDFSKLFEILEDNNGAEKLADELITAKIFADAEKTAEGSALKLEEKENV